MLLQTFPTWLQWFVFRKGERLSAKGQPPLIPLLPFHPLPAAGCRLSIPREARKHGLPGASSSPPAVRALGGWGRGQVGWTESLYSLTLCLPPAPLSLGSSSPRPPRPPASATTLSCAASAPASCSAHRWARSLTWLCHRVLLLLAEVPHPQLRGDRRVDVSSRET